MQWRNTSSRYGVFSLFLHWGSALVVFGLFGLGLWMRELSYYDPWYHPAPALHKSIGILLAIALLVRIVWRFVSPPPPAPANHGPLTRVASKLGHLALYGLLLAVIVLYVLEPSVLNLVLVLAIGATLTVKVLSVFEDSLQEMVVLSLFVPLIIGTGGNTGNQAATTVTRALALGDVRPRDALRVLVQERTDPDGRVLPGRFLRERHTIDETVREVFEHKVGVRPSEVLGTELGLELRDEHRAVGRVKEVTSLSNPLVKDIKALAEAIKAAPPGKLKASGTGQGGIWHLALIGWLIAH